MDKREYAKPTLQRVELIATTGAIYPCRNVILAAGPSEVQGVGDCQVGDGQQCYNIVS